MKAFLADNAMYVATLFRTLAQLDKIKEEFVEMPGGWQDGVIRIERTETQGEHGRRESFEQRATMPASIIEASLPHIRAAVVAELLSYGVVLSERDPA